MYSALGSSDLQLLRVAGTAAAREGLMRVAFILFLASAVFSYADENAAGRWEGSVQIPDRQLKLVVDLETENTGSGWQGSITIPGLGLKGAPLSNIALNGSD